jgi:hypothetical protein
MRKNSAILDPNNCGAGVQFVRALVLILFANVISGGCGTWAGNPKEPDADPAPSSGDSKVTLNIQGLDAATNLTATVFTVTGKNGEKIGTITLSEARVNLKEIKIKSNGSDSVSREKFPGPFVVDLLTHSSVPAFDTISLQAGVYRSIELILAKHEKGKSSGTIDQHDPINGKSVIISGTFAPLAGPEKLVTLTLELDEKFEIGLAGSRSGIDIAAAQLNTVIVGFHLETWFDFSADQWDFSDINDAAITLDKDGKSESSKKVLESVKEHIKGSAEFARDKDHDGKITDKDDDEDTVIERENKESDN